MELDDLFEEQRSLNDRIKNFFGDDDSCPNYGDRGFQDLLEQLNDVDNKIDEIIDGDDNLF